jgi:nitrogen fixation NifU-like protein
MYSEKVMEHFKHPKNHGVIKGADGIGKIGNRRCGDVMWIYIKVEGNRIADIKFKTMGCAAAIASSSILTEAAKGKTLEEAARITSKGLAEELGGLPPVKLHCSVLAADALAEAIYDYYKKEKKPVPKDLQRRHDTLKKRGEEHH